jgi:short-subunit dehydrogenase
MYYMPGASTAQIKLSECFLKQIVVVGDLMSIAETRRIAEQVNGLGAFGSVIRNAGVGYREPKRIATEDGMPNVLAVNTIAPYILTALVSRPQRLVYLSSSVQFSIKKGTPVSRI